MLKHPSHEFLEYHFSKLLNSTDDAVASMSSSVQKLVSLATCGNLILQGRCFPKDFESLLVRHCDNMRFIEPLEIGIVGSSRTIASSAENWFNVLQENGARRILIQYHNTPFSTIPDHYDQAFIRTGSIWGVEVRFDEYSHRYHKVDGSSRITFVRSIPEYRHSGDSPSVDEARQRLGAVLDSLSELTHKADHTQHWFEIFNRARQCLDASQRLTVFDFIPDGTYSETAMRLLDASFASWVFGGEGSWNDDTFQGADMDRYDMLTLELYLAICYAMVAVVNSDRFG